MTRVALALAFAFGLALSATPTAHAKLCVAIEAPREARAGSVIVARVTTFTPSWDGLRIVDRRPERATFALRLTVRGPQGSYRELWLRRTRNPMIWRGKVKLSSPGHWELRAAGWERAPRACAPPVRIRVFP
jgi:hypothetical protein